MLHSVVVHDQLASGGLSSFDLGVNPLSVLLVALRPLNDTGTLANFNRYLQIVGAIDRLTILHRGAAIIAMSGRDIAALNFYRWGIMPSEANSDDTTNERRCVVLPILLGRRAFDPLSCFPASRRGELILELDLDIADTGYDGLRITVESVELLGAQPLEFERRVQITQTMVVGDNDVQLPVGNFLRGVLCFGTTPFGGATPAPSWGRISFLVDQQQIRYASTDFEVAQMLTMLKGIQGPNNDAHIHHVDATACSAAEPTTAASVRGTGGWENYAYLDFDVTRNDVYSVDTRGRSNVVVRANAETADAVRAVAMERIALRG